MARPELVQTIARALNNLGASAVFIGGGVSLAYNALFTGARQPLPEHRFTPGNVKMEAVAATSHHLRNLRLLCGGLMRMRRPVETSANQVD